MSCIFSSWLFLRRIFRLPSFVTCRPNKRSLIIAVVVVTVIVVAIVIALAIVFTGKKQSEPDKPVTKPHPSVTPAPKSILPPPTGPPGADGPYKHAVVASDAGPCSEIGRDILKKGGSAVDSAIAALFCVGVYNMHSAGVGGGGFMVVYKKSTRFVEAIDFREEAPGKATRTMYVGGAMSSTLGELHFVNEKWSFAEGSNSPTQILS